MYPALKLIAISLTIGLLSLALSGPGQAGSLHYSHGTHGGHGSHYGSHYRHHGAHGLLSYVFGHRQRHHYGYNYGHHDRYRYGSNHGVRTYSPSATYNSDAHASHGANYNAQGSGCHAVYKTGYWDGHRAKIGGTMCYDSYGKSYVVSGSRYLIKYY